jgi:hypothetical protein
MFDMTDILCGVLILGFFAYILIDSYRFGKKIEKQRKERNEERVKEGKKPIDYDNVSVGGGYSSSDSSAADNFRSTIFRNMGMMG